MPVVPTNPVVDEPIVTIDRDLATDFANLAKLRGLSPSQMFELCADTAKDMVQCSLRGEVYRAGRRILRTIDCTNLALIKSPVRLVIPFTEQSEEDVNRVARWMQCRRGPAVDHILRISVPWLTAIARGWKAHYHRGDEVVITIHN